MRRTTVRGTSLWAWLLGAIFSAAGFLILWVLKGLGWFGMQLLTWAFHHPRTMLGLGLPTAAVLLIGWQWVVGIVGVVLLSGSVWSAADRASFDRIVTAWLRDWHQTWWRYRRVWERVMTRCGLVVEVDDERHFPRLRSVQTTPYWDRLVIEMQVGQELADFENATGKLRTAFGGERLVVRELIPPRKISVELMRRDPFRYETVPAAEMPKATADIDFTALPIGLDEHLEPLTISMVGGHTAAAGATGAGKAGVEWNVLRSLAPAIADGTVRPVFIDPKARELRRGLALVDAGVYGTPTPEMTTRGRRLDDGNQGPQPTGDYAVTEWDTICLLERIAAEVHEANMRGAEAGERDFKPSKRTPLRPIFIDELAPLLAYWSRGGTDRIEAALGLILTQGRAAGYIVVGLIQEPTKDIFKVRDLFQRRIGLRLPTEDHTDAALTDNAVDRGADCSNIPESLPGVCYSFHEKDKKAIRGRLGHVTDDDIDELVEFVTDMRKVTSINANQPDVDVEIIDTDVEDVA